jgi:hypothetical protein
MKTKKKAILEQGTKRFAVETVNTFYEVHIVHAKNEEEARFIAENSDYNASKWLGQQIANISECSDSDLVRFKKIDDYFFAGSAKVDEDGCLVYIKEDGTINGNMPRQKIC